MPKYTVTAEYGEYFEVDIEADSVQEAKDALVANIADYTPSDGGWNWLKAEISEKEEEE